MNETQLSENKKPKIMIGMSGGVDSSVSAVLLKQQGYEVAGVTMKLVCGKEKEVEDAKKVCEKLGIKHYCLEEVKEFRDRVIEPFVSCYERCLTPNPCVECNHYLKFGKMYEFAKSMGYDKIATGHYAKIEKNEETGEYLLKKSDSESKDQSYVLYGVPREMLSNIVFPLEKYKSKDEIRKIAAENNLEIAQKPDSQDICFIPDGDYANFLELNNIKKLGEGNIVNRKGNVLGKHKGLYHYTVGQRKGLGISNPVPLFVLGFNEAKNELIVGEEKELYRKEFTVNNVNWLVEGNKEGLAVCVKVRYKSKEAKAVLNLKGEKVIVKLEEPQKGITPGQSAVFYKGDVVIGGGKIERELI